jgi:hypothetical protein
MEQRVADLIGRMTLEEKAQQLNHLNVGIPRLKVTSQLVEPEHTLQFHQPILVAIERRDGTRFTSDDRPPNRRARSLTSHSPAGDLASAPPSSRHRPVGPQTI